MSISAEIQSILRDKRLIELKPAVSSDTQRRYMYLEPVLHNDIFRSRSDDKKTERFAQLQADLDMFLTSETIDPNYLFGLSPKGCGVWEIKSVRPRPAIRVFGSFSRKDVFIATHYIERKSLGSFKSVEWKKEIRRSKAIWRKLLHPYPPMNSSEINHLISGAINEKYFK